MKCFECKKEVNDESDAIHIGDGDFVHTGCLTEYETKKDEFFENIHKDGWYKKWLTE